MIALIDCNNFYVSCERVFQPLLIGRPLIILSNNDGCAISRSNEAKELGIKMGTPHFEIEELIRQYNVQIRSSNYALYGDMSQRVMQIIKSFVPKTEVYSIDEIFCDLSDLEQYHDLTELGIRIRATVKQYTGIPVSVGIAPTKVLAKMANRYVKKQWIESGVYYAGTPEIVDRLLNFTPVGNIWGIGKEHETFLITHGFITAADLVKAPEEWIRKELSVKGQRLLTELKGTSCMEFTEVKAPKKNIATTRSFGKLITSKKEVQQALASHTASCGAKLRKERSCARKLHVFIQTDNFRTQDKQYAPSITIELPVATNSTPELIRYALKALELIYKDGYNYKKTGVIALELIPAPSVQMGLFDGVNRKKEETLMQALDNINVSYGRDAVRYSVQGYGKEWKLRQEHLSPCYTTHFDQIKEVS
jgi:DNA polymerase V